MPTQKTPNQQKNGHSINQQKNSHPINRMPTQKNADTEKCRHRKISSNGSNGSNGRTPTNQPKQAIAQQQRHHCITMTVTEDGHRRDRPGRIASCLVNGCLGILRCACRCHLRRLTTSSLDGCWRSRVGGVLVSKEIWQPHRRLPYNVRSIDVTYIC